MNQWAEVSFHMLGKIVWNEILNKERNWTQSSPRVLLYHVPFTPGWTQKSISTTWYSMVARQGGGEIWLHSIHQLVTRKYGHVCQYLMTHVFLLQSIQCRASHIQVFQKIRVLYPLTFFYQELKPWREWSKLLMRIVEFPDEGRALSPFINKMGYTCYGDVKYVGCVGCQPRQAGHGFAKSHHVSKVKEEDWDLIIAYI